MPLTHTPPFDEALLLMQLGGPFTFITGRAGTGKSTLLKYFRETSQLIAPVLAPTGVAALNVNGETIHRFFGFTPGITVKEARKKGNSPRDPNLYRHADLLVIDEISMVRADLMDSMDAFLQEVRRDKRPFGGLRIVAIGDLYQLPPVVTSSERDAFSQLYASPYFFASHVMKKLLAANEVACVELEKVFRQSDESFISLLNAVRDRRVTPDDYHRLNQRVHAIPPDDAIMLTAINASAEELNQVRLDELPGDATVFHGRLSGEFPDRDVPADGELRLKVGARVMCVANDQEGRFVNGSLGWVEALGDDPEKPDENAERAVIVRLDDGGTVSIPSYTWTVYRSIYDRETKSLDQEKIGSFTQIPLRLAWAVTIHKSQGKTFDHVVINLGTGAFAAGQTYVALSRCRSLEGVALVKPIKPQDIRLDTSIVKFMTTLKAGEAFEPEEQEVRYETGMLEF